MKIVKAIFGVLFTLASLGLAAIAFFGEARGEISNLRSNDAPAELGIAFGLLFIGIVFFATIGGKKPAPTIGIGSFVMVRSNDGHQHHGRIDQIANGQYLVTMAQGQFWVPPSVLSIH